jgi:hypothetical protein
MPAGRTDGPGGPEDRSAGASRHPDGPEADKGDRPQGPPQGGPDFASAAEKLGITEELLLAALGDPGRGRPDFAAAAEKLGITEEELLAALGVEEGSMPPRGN